MACGQLWTVCRCGWCGVKYRLDPDEAQRLVAYLRDWDSHSAAYCQRLCDRIEAGYNRLPAHIDN
jgi:hypothetical protein